MQLTGQQLLSHLHKLTGDGDATIEHDGFVTYETPSNWLIKHDEYIIDLVQELPTHILLISQVEGGYTIPIDHTTPNTFEIFELVPVVLM